MDRLGDGTTQAASVHAGHLLRGSSGAASALRLWRAPKNSDPTAEYGSCLTLWTFSDDFAVPRASDAELGPMD